MAAHVGNFLVQQRQNTRMTTVLVVIFFSYWLLIGYGTDVFVFRNDMFGFVYPPSDELPYAMIITFLLSLAYTIFSYYRGDQLVIGSIDPRRCLWLEGSAIFTTTQRIWRDDANYKTLVDAIHQMSIAAGVPMPSIYLVPDPDPNAMATGRDQWNASIVVTTGLLDKLQPDELRAVIAHEMAHIRNHDIRLMMLLSTLMGAGALLSANAAFRMVEGSLSVLRRSVMIGIFFWIWLGMTVFAPIISWAFTLLISHEREYQADATAAQLTRDPASMLRALERIDRYAGPTRSINPAVGHMCITSPLSKYMQMDEETLRQRVQFNTHPPMEKRISAMKEMAFMTHEPVTTHITEGEKK